MGLSQDRFRNHVVYDFRQVRAKDFDVPFANIIAKIDAGLLSSGGA